MTPPLGEFGVWISTSALTLELASKIENLGYGAVWMGGSPSGDLAAVEEILDATDSITVATGIVNMWKDEPENVADSFLRIQERHHGRFLLGVGVGHRERTPGYQSPYRKMVDYLDRLAGRGVPGHSTILAALGPRALSLASERTAGTHPYFTTPRHTRLAREAIGPDSVVAPEQTVVLDADVRRARETARTFMARYLGTVNYSNSLRREGWGESDLVAGGSDRLVDEIVVHGDPGEVASGVRRHLRSGATHVCVQVLDEQRALALSALAEALGLT